MRAAVPAAAIMLCAAVALVEAQRPVPLRDGCARCRLDIDRLVSLGDESEAHVSFANAVVRDSHGRFLVATRARPFEILVFSPDGALLTSIGRRGNGPGEFQWVARLFPIGADTVHVFDLQQHRWTVLSPTRQVLRVAPYPGNFNHQAAVFSNGNAVLNLFLGTPATAGTPLHLIGSDGRIIRSFGDEARQPVRYDVPSGWARVLARASDTTVWAAAINEYRIALWQLGGRKLLELVRQPRPFAPWAETRLISPSDPPQAIIRAIHQDASGYLWVLYHVPDSRWHEAVEQMRTPEGSSWVGDRDRLFDTVLEVIDPGRRIVLASGRLDAALEGFADDGVAFSFSEARRQIELWQVRVYLP